MTGQQVGLFLGPLYTFYKAATRDRGRARARAPRSGVRCVPIFWLQTEDHDFAEIAHCHVPRADGAAPLELRDRRRPAAAARALGGAARARRRGRGAARRARRRARAALPHARGDRRCSRALSAGRAARARAFAGVLAALFADEGLVVFDPRDAAVARLAAPIDPRGARRARAASTRCSPSAGAALAAAGFDEQVHAAPGSPLRFFHAGDAHGPRYRLAPRARERRRVDAIGTATRRRLLDRRRAARALLERAIRCASPPRRCCGRIVQDTLLPTAAYVGGPAEVDYFAQLAAALSRCSGSPPPLVVPRARFRLIAGAGAHAARQARRSRPPTLEQPRDELLAQAERPRRARRRRRASADRAPGSPSWSSGSTRSTARAGAPIPSSRRAVERTRETVRRAPRAARAPLRTARCVERDGPLRRARRSPAALALSRRHAAGARTTRLPCVRRARRRRRAHRDA